MKIRSLIIDDNKFIRTLLSELLVENHPEIEVVAMAASGGEGIELIESCQPDLVFLDIEMPDMTGFEMLSRLSSISFRTIFTTSYSQYAITAFRFNALDYLLKPIKADELEQAIRRFKGHAQHQDPTHIGDALQNLKEQNKEDQRLILYTQKGRLQLALKHIVKIEGDRNYSYIYLSDNTKELSSKTLGYFEEILSDKGFFRCHRSFLVNRYHVISYTVKKTFQLRDATTVPISRRKWVESLQWYDG